jgi:hypothetical protein
MGCVRVGQQAAAKRDLLFWLMIIIRSQKSTQGKGQMNSTA